MSSQQPQRWAGRAAVKGGSETIRMALLSFVSVGVTFTWGVEVTYCTPYLLSLGLTKGQTSLVWIAGPLSGLVVQPIVGVVSDASTSPWGRRRPFIACCSVVVALSLLTLGFTRELVDLFFGPSMPPSTMAEAAAGTDTPSSLLKAITVVLAVLALYTTDFAINAVMSCARSLIVDTLPIHKQQSGAAWYSRMSSIGHILGYGAGAVDLVALFGPALGDSQFKKLTLIAAAGILASAALTCWAVEERVLLAPPADDDHDHPLLPNSATAAATRHPAEPRFRVVRQIWSTLLCLPPRIQAICWAVFWSWIGWFPFMIYSSTWVGETYFRYDAPVAGDSRSGDDALGDMGRIGSYALTIYSTVTFIGAWILPFFVRSPDDDEGPVPAAGQAPSLPSPVSAAVSGVGGILLNNPLAARLQRLRASPELARQLARLHHAKPDLLTVWFVAHLMFAFAMSLAPWASSFHFATILVAFCGIPWTIANWAPIAFIGVEVNRLSGPSPPTAAAAYRRRRASSSLEMGPLPGRVGTNTLLPGGGVGRHLDGYDDDDDDEKDRRDGGDDVEHLIQARAASSTGGGGGELSGVYFGILNIYVTLPQFIGTLISAFVFALLEPGKSPELATDAHPSEHHPTDGPNAIAVCLFIGSLSALAAAYATSKLRHM